jgi:hypothetical protein
LELAMEVNEVPSVKKPAATSLFFLLFSML